MIKVLYFTMLRGGGLEAAINNRLAEIAVREQADVKIISMSVSGDEMYVLVEVTAC